MTTLATRTDTRPAVIDGTAVDGVIVPTGPNPHRVNAIASALLMGGAGLGAGWSVVHDYQRADLSAGAFFVTILLFVLVMSRFNSFERGDC
jgi:hypothetical protein